MDAVAPPVPWLGPRVRERLREDRDQDRRKPVRRRPADFAWLLAVVAVLLALAIIVTLVAGSHLLTPKVEPVKPNPGATAPCPTWGFIPGGGNAPASIHMMSTTVGWAPGDLRTTDGAQHWHDVSPKELRVGQPFLPGQQTVYPPSYTDFFLDANRAWLLRSYESPTACIDHYGIFSTKDGGQIWRGSMVATLFATGLDPTPALDFLDAQYGWLVLSVSSSGRVASPPPTLSLVYRTTDGGQSWRLISSAGPRCPSVEFISSSRGFSACGSQFSGSGQLWSTTDGGATWSTERSPAGSTQDQVAQPVFFDSSHGATVDYQNGGYAIDITSDGGATWSQTASASSGSTFVPGGFQPYAANVGFEDAHDFWLFATQPGWAKGGVEMDWLFHSSDGGATWQLVQRDTPASAPSIISFLDPQHGFVLQSDPTGTTEVLVTSDGGHTWAALKVQIS
jgi:photosystem II stability/assembly factor-like uncharacterized protein